ncbi:MAG: type II toxin-antitoxin system prevent-host-death family antitoxin [Actinomycetota bacterium]|nr:type II toxin-antitoxin system prevent-host-death family antitoxin [Actinomycetota bacterium]
MIRVRVEEAQAHLSRLLRQVEEGDEVVLDRDGRPVARIVPLEPQGRRFGGRLAGRVHVPDDVDNPLPDDLLDLFEGGPVWPCSS